MSRGALGLSSLKFSLLCFDPGGVFFLPPGWSCAVLQGQVLWGTGTTCKHSTVWLVLKAAGDGVPRLAPHLGCRVILHSKQ